MTATLSRAEQLRNDLENMQFSRKYLIGVLAELEQLGRTHKKEYINVKKLRHYRQQYPKSSSRARKSRRG